MSDKSRDVLDEVLEQERHEQGAAPRLHLRVQTPRGLWTVGQPPHAPKQPVYPPDTPVQVVIDDAREVFKFVENDSKYTLFHEGVELAATRTLANYDLKQEALLVLSVQGGNA